MHFSDQCHQVLDLIRQLNDLAILELDLSLSDVQIRDYLLMLGLWDHVLTLLPDFKLKLLIQDDLLIQLT